MGAGSSACFPLYIGVLWPSVFFRLTSHFSPFMSFHFGIQGGSQHLLHGICRGGAGKGSSYRRVERYLRQEGLFQRCASAVIANTFSSFAEASIVPWMCIFCVRKHPQYISINYHTYPLDRFCALTRTPTPTPLTYIYTTCLSFPLLSSPFLSFPLLSSPLLFYGKTLFSSIGHYEVPMFDESSQRSFYHTREYEVRLSLNHTRNKFWLTS